jgi:hypothetical protein
MGLWLLTFLQTLVQAISNYIESAERSRRDEVELKIYRELLAELKKLMAPILNSASNAAEIGEATFNQVLALMRVAVVALASYAQNSVADCMEDRSQSAVLAAQAGTRLYEALEVLLNVIQSQRKWLNDHFPAQRRFTWFTNQPRPFVRPLYLAMQAMELATMLDSVKQEAERAQRDLSQERHPANYILQNMLSAIAAAAAASAAAPSTLPSGAAANAAGAITPPDAATNATMPTMPTTPTTPATPTIPTMPAFTTSMTMPLATPSTTPAALSPRDSLSAHQKHQLVQISENIDKLKELYEAALLFAEEFAGQAKKRLEDHTRPGGGVNAIIVRAQLALVISLCIHCRLVVDGLHAAIIEADKNIIDI